MGTMSLPFLIVFLGATAGCADASPAAPRLQQAASESEKDSRTPAQRKINSQLLYEIYRRRGEAEEKGVPPGPTDVKIDADDLAFVDVRAEVTPALLETIYSLDGKIVTTSPEHRSIIAWVPLLELERLAEDDEVTFIEPAPEAKTRRPDGTPEP